MYKLSAKPSGSTVINKQICCIYQGCWNRMALANQAGFVMLNPSFYVGTEHMSVFVQRDVLQLLLGKKKQLVGGGQHDEQSRS